MTTRRDGRWRSGRWLPASVGAGAALAALAYCFSFEEPWALRGENATSLFPMAADAWRQWTDGRFPGWTSSIFGGFPLFAGAQSCALYLPHAIAFALTPAPNWRAVDVALALHAGLLAAGCMRLLLSLGARPAAALFGASVCLVAPQIVYWTNFFPIYVSLAWWPWLFAAAERLGREAALPLGALLLGAVALAAQVAAGFAEYAVYSGFIAAVWIVSTRDRCAPFGARIARTALLAVAGGLLAAPQLVATLFELSADGRTLGDQQTSLAGAVSLGAILDPVAEPASGMFSVFLGGATLLLGGIALALRAPRSALLLCVGGFASLMALGPDTPVYALVSEVPPFSAFRNPIKYVTVVEMCVAVLAAQGLEALLRASERDRRVLVAAALLSLLALAEHAAYFVRQLSVVALPHVAGELAVPRDLRGFAELVPELRSGSAAPHRMVDVGPTSLDSLPQVYGVETILGAPPAMLSPRQRELLRRFTSPGWQGLRRADPAWLALFGVDSVVLRGSCDDARLAGLRAVRSEDDYCLLQSDESTPRVELLERVAIAEDEEAELRRIVDHPAPPLPVVYPGPRRGKDAPPWRTPGRLQRDERARIVAFAPGSLRVEITSRAERLVLIRETRDPGWRARLDGEDAPILPAAGMFFAVPVPPGESTLELRYTPRGLAAGFALQGVFVVSCATVAIRRARSAGSRLVS